MHKKSRKLTLKSESIRTLTSLSLGGIRGGAPNTDVFSDCNNCNTQVEGDCPTTVNSSFCSGQACDPTTRKCWPRP